MTDDAGGRAAIRALLRWYRTEKRDLPWRDVNDAYRIFVSEIMLQQTQVDRVIPKYRAWLRRFPTWERLAGAKTAELLHAWAGLGYNRRALQVREAARQVVTRGVPTDEKGWRALNGVGPYSAAALAEFADHRFAVVIDTNVRRVAGRLFLGKPFPSASDDARLRRVLGRAVPRRGRHWDVPQAFMDLGSSICASSSPRCAVCPLRRMCAAAPKFVSDKKPTRPVRRITERRHRGKPHPDRIYRGRILAWIRTHGPTPADRIGRFADESFDRRRDGDWMEAMIRRLVKDGLVEISNGIVRIPTN